MPALFLYRFWPESAINLLSIGELADMLGIALVTLRIALAESTGQGLDESLACLDVLAKKNKGQREAVPLF